jgi:hypothetical protein
MTNDNTKLTLEQELEALVKQLLSGELSARDWREALYRASEVIDALGQTRCDVLMQAKLRRLRQLGVKVIAVTHPDGHTDTLRSLDS